MQTCVFLPHEKCVKLYPTKRQFEFQSYGVRVVTTPARLIFNIVASSSYAAPAAVHGSRQLSNLRTFFGQKVIPPCYIPHNTFGHVSLGNYTLWVAVKTFRGEEHISLQSVAAAQAKLCCGHAVELAERR